MTSFTPPDTVLSPKGAVTDLRVLYNTGEGGWSLSRLNWKGNESLGIRWNGSGENRIGNPQSRGVPTWFIVPDELHADLQQRFDRSLKGITDDNDDITRIRIRPMPIRILEGKRQDDADHDWILSITDRKREEMEANNIATGHRIGLSRQHIKALIPDTTRDTPNGPKHGILDLTIQLIFEDGEIRFEPHPTLVDRINELSFELRDTGYSGQHTSVLELIEDARSALIDFSGKLGDWESECLGFAETAVNDNFLRLAMSQMHKAVEVSNLPIDEYRAGYNYTTRRT